MDTYIVALDGKKQPRTIRSTNAGHTLFTEIATQDRAERIAKGLLEEDLFWRRNPDNSDN